MKQAISVQEFDHKMFGAIRGAEIKGQPWFVGNDLAAALGYKDPARAIVQHVPQKHKRLIRLGDTVGSLANRQQTPVNLGGNPNQMMVSEPGMYRLIFHSKLKAADDFVEWVTADVLPTLRATGQYSIGARLMAPEVQALMDGKTDDEIKTALAQYDRRVAGNAKRKATNAAKKARQYWSDDQILVAIGRVISSRLCGGRFGDGTLTMYGVIENQCHIPLSDRQKVWQKGYGVGTPSAKKRCLYTFILPEEIPGVLQGLTEYCSSNGVDISDIVSRRQTRLAGAV